MWGSWLAPTGVAVVGMSWNLRWVFVGVVAVSYSGASVVDSIVALGVLWVFVRFVC